MHHVESDTMKFMPFIRISPRILYASASLAFLCAMTPMAASARDHIRIVGSSTVFPFVSAAAEEFGRSTDFRTPIVEATGTGGGFKLFCEGANENTPDISNASRPIKDSEKKLCEKNGVTSITEISIGFDGIVLANTKQEKPINLTIQQLFLALAQDVPSQGKLIANPYKTWHDIDASLPDTAIEVYGPPPTSGTRDAFVEIVMEKGCEVFPEFKAAHPDKEARKKQCHTLREDGGFVDAGENDNIIVQKLIGNPKAFGIFGFGFLEENSAVVQGNPINKIDPTYTNIADASYPVARSLYVYIKNAHLAQVVGMKEFMQELTSVEAMSEDGYLADAGLIALPADQQAIMRERVAKLQAE
jgi:phosphate transport system substrate-binding protein